MEPESSIEKRNSIRRLLYAPAIIRFGTKYTGRGVARNISTSGVYIENVNFLKMLSPATLRNLRGFPIKIKPVNNTVYLEGKIAWADFEKGCLGVSITSVSSDDGWQQMLSEASIVL